jgi:hypothetical protein
MLVRLSSLALLLATAPLSAQEPCFDGTGGPGGDFDWVVHDGEIFFFDTTFTAVVGGPDGVPTTVQNCVDGVIDLRHLFVEEGGQIRVQGPNRMLILATGDVMIRGTIDVSGFNAKDVATLNTGNQTERGGAGAAGGGPGGNGNPVTTNSSPRGGPGQGPFGEVNTGGEGGETAYADGFQGKDARRPGGGGGGRFGRDQGNQSLGLAATAGRDGNPAGRGAETDVRPARGGQAGIGPFLDAKPGNDFFGVRPVLGGRGELVHLIRGELPTLWAGYGGGGGGNADPASTFPTPNWNIGSDEKGGGGGGGGGQLHVQALGRIVFGAAGLIRSNGAFGGTGENTFFLDHVGGTGGAGTGGHVVLESASEIDFTDRGAYTGVLPRDWLQALGKPIKTGPTSDVNACCRTQSNGGAGGPGVVQLHVPDPVAPPGTDPARTDIVVPLAAAVARFPLDQVSSPGAIALFPTCDPFPGLSYGWLAAGAAGSFLRIPLLPEAPAVPAGALALDPEALELPPLF